MVNCSHSSLIVDIYCEVDMTDVELKEKFSLSDGDIRCPSCGKLFTGAFTLSEVIETNKYDESEFE